MFELDHFFIMVAQDAPEAELLTKFGLSEGTSRDHPGQGTKNRRFFFHNCMLELLWVRDPEEARNELTRPTHLYERWKSRDKYCPFGVAVRPRTGEAAKANTPPFPAWVYKPRYLPESLSIKVAETNWDFYLPWLFYLDFAKRPDQSDQNEIMTHDCGFKEVTHLRIVTPRPDPEATSERLCKPCNKAELATGEDYIMELSFDHGAAGKSHSFLPQLPLVFRW